MSEKTREMFDNFDRGRFENEITIGLLRLTRSTDDLKRLVGLKSHEFAEYERETFIPALDKIQYGKLKKLGFVSKTKRNPQLKRTQPQVVIVKVPSAAPWKYSMKHFAEVLSLTRKDVAFNIRF
ncbi:MAG: hypothetical protein O7D34_11215 [Ignavibacteria bacterium]|nr:hypothetical protein [Ignavibacteria bacterium]